MEHKYKIVVRYNECDMYGHVNHAVYLNYLECARIEFLKSRGISIEVLAGNGFRLFVTYVAIDYKLAARFGEELEIFTNLIAIKIIKGKFKQTIVSANRIIAEAEVSWACIDNQGKPVRIPEEIINLQSNTDNRTV